MAVVGGDSGEVDQWMATISGLGGNYGQSTANPNGLKLRWRLAKGEISGQLAEGRGISWKC